MIRPLLLVSTIAITACQPVQDDEASLAATTTSTAGATDTSGLDRVALFAEAAEARDICQATMPNIRATRDALVSAGYGTIFTNSEFSLQSREWTDAIVIVSRPSRNPACGVIVRAMDPAEARRLIQPWLEAADATPIDATNPDISNAWTGTFAGGPVELAIRDEIRLPGLIRGAAIMARGALGR